MSSSPAVRPPRIVFFDIGNVLLHFDNRLACRRVAALAGVEPELVWQAWFGSDLWVRHELGQITGRDLWAELSAAVDANFDYDAFVPAASAIFRVNVPAKTLAGQLYKAGYRLGLLSNTNDLHWHYFLDGRYAHLPAWFDVPVASFQIRAMKPNAEIYEAAARLAGVEPHEALFTDDLVANVEGAREAGFDAVPFTTAARLGDELRARGLRFNL